MASDSPKCAGRPRCHPSPHPRKHSLDFHLHPVAISLGDDTHSTSGWHPHTRSHTISGYQVPRPATSPQPRPPPRLSSTPSVDSLTQAELHATIPTPPPRPPKPPAIAAQAESSCLGWGPATLPRSSSEPERRDGRTEAGGERGGIGLPRSSAITMPGCTQTGGEKANTFEFSDSFSSYFFNKGMVPLGSVCSEDDNVDENYVPMSAATMEPPVAPRVPAPPPSLTSDPSIQLQDPNYIPMTPLTSGLPSHPSHAPAELESLGRQVPPPVHTGFRSSPLTPAAPATPPLRRNPGDVEVLPPPVLRNLKPQRRVKPAPLDISPVQHDWQEVPPPVRSPVTRTFTRDLSSCQSLGPSSAHSSSLSSDSDDPDDNYVAMTTSGLSSSAGEQSLRTLLHRASEGGVSSPLLRQVRGDKQVEYLDLDLHTGRVIPTRQRSTAEGGASGAERGGAGEERMRGQRIRVDYVVVDPKRTKALRNTREAWHDGRMSTEKDKC